MVHYQVIYFKGSIEKTEKIGGVPPPREKEEGLAESLSFCPIENALVNSTICCKWRRWNRDSWTASRFQTDQAYRRTRSG